MRNLAFLRVEFEAIQANSTSRSVIPGLLSFSFSLFFNSTFFGRIVKFLIGLLSFCLVLFLWKFLELHEVALIVNFSCVWLEVS